MDIGVAISLVVTTLLLILGVEILVCMGIGAVLLTVLTGAFTLENVSAAAFQGLNSFPLIAMPLFILTGDLIGASGMAKTLTELSRQILGWMRGGMAHATIFACGLFSAISGSNSATVATIGKITIPEMKKEGYPLDFAAATAAYGGTTGIIIPPSLIFIIYGVVAGASVSDLFLGGTIPGFLMVLFMCVGGYIHCRKRNWGTTIPFSWRKTLRATWDAQLSVVCMILILGGIYGGVFTPTEAAAVACAYCAGIGFATGNMKIKDLHKITETSATINGFIAPIVAMAVVFAQILSFLHLPQSGVSALLALTDNPTIMVGLLLLILLIAGCVMECTPNVILLAPILTPVALNLGFHPIHWGVVFVTALSIGFVTPPVGLDLFVASAITGVPYAKIASVGVLYFIGLMVALIVITVFPWFTLVLVPK
jgi:C4-dicarboxylate transporter DctM subunit